MAKKVIFFSIISLLLFFALSDFSLAAVKTCDPSDPNACPRGQSCRADPCGGTGYKCGRPLEICYPKFLGDTQPVPETTATGLPDYVKYIFQLSIVIIGFVIFAVMVYNGVQYLVSSGDPAKLTDAREGIFNAFLGAIILLSAYILFNTINPQLTILTLPEVSSLETVVTPGAYICSYKTTENIEDILKTYLSEGPIPSTPEARTEMTEKQLEAAKKLKKIMLPDPTDNAKRCMRVNFSGNFDNFVVEKDYTMFIVPSVVITSDPGSTIPVRKAKYEYGIVLHEKDNFRGQCKLYPDPDSNFRLYTANDEAHQIADYKAKGWYTTAKSVTVFEKPTTDPSSDAKGVILYECYGYGTAKTLCPDGVTYPGLFRPFSLASVGGDFLGITAVLGDLAEGNTRSVKIDPQGSYFALFFDEAVAGHEGETDFTGNCAVVKKTTANTTATISLHYCGKKCTGGTYFWDLIRTNNQYECLPCLRSMIIIKGEVL